MAVDFPISPSIGQNYVAAGVTWVWDGAKWNSSATVGGPYLPLAGGTLTGPLGGTTATFSGAVTLPADPTLALQAATKQYADAQAAAKVGVTDGSNAAPGQIGEVVSLNVSAGVSLTSAVAANIGAGIALTAGDWDVTGEVWFAPVGGAAPTTLLAAISSVSATAPAGSALNTGRSQINATLTPTAIQVLNVRRCRVSLSAGATYYLVAEIIFTGGTANATGNIIARRVR